MNSALTLECVAKDFEKWRSQRGADRRMPEELLRAAAIVAEQNSVAVVAGRLNLNHTRLSRAVSLLQNERLSPIQNSGASKALGSHDAQHSTSLTFTKVEAADVSREATPLLAPRLRTHAQLFLTGGVRLEVTSICAFRTLCRAILKGNA